ncbi:MAG: flagellar hook-associated protein FlgK [Minwuia sp.]|nr:flagellar hook-associated protein FlgK [Minwuia sp.]
MSLNGILSTGTSGLLAAQVGLSTVSDNIANVNTEGYARKEARQDNRVIGGQSTGVQVSEVRRIADSFLSQEFRIAAAESGRFEAMDELQQQMTALLGDPTQDRTLVSRLDDVFNAAAALANNPETTATRNATLDALQRLDEDIDLVASGARDLQRQADQRVGDTVDTINELIAQIDSLNRDIGKRLEGSDNNALLDQRARKLDELGELIDIRTFDLGQGKLAVSTNAGLPLVDQAARRIVHVPNDAANAGQTFPQLTIERVDSATGQATAVNGTIDSSIRSGTLRGLMDIRDTTLNDLAVELGAMTGHVADELNRIHNDFTAVPPPAEMVGRNTGALATDPHGFTGIATFHAFDGNNAVTASATIDFGAIGGTVQDAINAVNTGLGGQGTLSLTNGTMTFSAAGAASGVAIQQDATTPSDNGGRGFAHRFGLNDLVRTGTGPTFDTGLTAATGHGFTGEMTLSLVGPANQRAITTTIDMAAIGGTVGDLVTQLNTSFSGLVDFSLDSAGKLSATPASVASSFRVEVLADNTARGATGASAANLFGLGSASVASIASGFSVASAIAGNPEGISLASIDASRSPAIGAGDNAGAQALQTLGNAEARFDGAGRLPAMTATLSEISSEFLGRAGQAAKDISVRAEDRLALRDELSQRVSEVSGVNLDEEMTNLITFQTAFNASARVISATQEMFDALLRI